MLKDNTIFFKKEKRKEKVLFAQNFCPKSGSDQKMVV